MRKILFLILIVIIQVCYSSNVFGDEILFQDRFSTGSNQEIWSPNDFTVVADSSSPDGDSYIFQRTSPGGSKSAFSQKTFTLDADTSFRTTAMIKVGDSLSSGQYASTCVGFWKNSTTQYWIGTNNHAPCIITLNRTGAIISNLTV